MREKLIFILFSILIFGTISAFAQSPAKRSALPKNVVKFEENKYRYPMYLLDNPAIKKRVRSLLGKKYSDFTAAIYTQEPIEKKGDFVIGKGCANGLCTIIEAVLLIDVSKNSITVGVFNSSDKSQFKYYSETPNEKPSAILKQWEKDIAKRSGK